MSNPEGKPMAKASEYTDPAAARQQEIAKQQEILARLRARIQEDEAKKASARVRVRGRGIIDGATFEKD